MSLNSLVENSQNISTFLSDWSQAKQFEVNSQQETPNNTKILPAGQTSNHEVVDCIQELMIHLNTIKQDLDCLSQDLKQRSQEITPNLLILLIRVTLS
jgi:uncharacterized protein involved in exopolysaccharide biosynthesis